MALMTIRLRCNPETGKKDIVISLESDADAMPHEHEQQHRSLVDKLINGGLLKAGEAGNLVVERVSKEQAGQAEPAPAEPQGQRQAQTQGQ